MAACLEKARLGLGVIGGELGRVWSDGLAKAGEGLRGLGAGLAPAGGNDQTQGRARLAHRDGLDHGAVEGGRHSEQEPRGHCLFTAHLSRAPS